MELVKGGNLYDQLHGLGLGLVEKMNSFVDCAMIHHSQVVLHSAAPHVHPKPVSFPKSPWKVAMGALKEVETGFNKWLLFWEERLEVDEERRRKGWAEVQSLKTEVIEGLKKIHSLDPHDPLLRPLCRRINQPTESLLALHIPELSPLTWDLRLKLALDVVLGLGFMHSLSPPILHRDLKTPNVFLERPLTNLVLTPETLKRPLAKLGDFGLSKRLSGLEELWSGEKMQNITPNWMAPEVIAGEPYTEKADIYAVGILLWELVERKHPFSEFLAGAEIIGNAITLGKRPILTPLKESEPKVALEFIELIHQCWDQKPSKRPPILKVYQILREIIDRHAPRLASQLEDDGVVLQGMPCEKPASKLRCTTSQDVCSIVKTIDLSNTADSIHEFARNDASSWEVLSMGMAVGWVWMGLGTGLVAALSMSAEERESVGGDGVYLCNEFAGHCAEVTAMTFQRSKDVVWSGAADGTIHVWKATPQTHEDVVDFVHGRGWVRWVGKLRQPDMWACLENGKLNLFRQKNSGSEEVSIEFGKETTASTVASNGKLVSIELVCGKTRVVISAPKTGRDKSPSLEWWYVLFGQLLRSARRRAILRIATTSTTNKSYLISLPSFPQDDSPKKKSRVSSLVALGHSVWCVTESVRVVGILLGGYTERTWVDEVAQGRK